MAKKETNQLDYELLLKAMLLVSKKIEILTDEVRLLRKELTNDPNKEGTN